MLKPAYRYGGMLPDWLCIAYVYELTEPVSYKVAGQEEERQTYYVVGQLRTKDCSVWPSSGLHGKPTTMTPLATLPRTDLNDHSVDLGKLLRCIGYHVTTPTSKR